MGGGVQIVGGGTCRPQQLTNLEKLQQRQQPDAAALRPKKIPRK